MRLRAVTAILSGDVSVASGNMNDSGGHKSRELSYEQLGHHFVHLLVTPGRVERELRALLAEPIEGEVSRLAVELLTAKYTFTLTDVQVVTRPEVMPQLGLRQKISGTIRLTVILLGITLRFTLRLVIHLEQIVRTYEPLTLKIETRQVDGSSVEIDVDAHDLPADILDRLNLIEGAVRAEVVDEVNKRINSGPIHAATTIDLHRLANEAKL